MPAALTVDQSLVDNYLARVNRFFDNVNRFEDTLREMTDGLKEKFTPAAPEKDASTYQETTVMQQPATVTAADIDLDDLLRGVDLGTPDLSV